VFVSPMRLLRVPQPFDHADFIYELKLDGFRALAHVERGRCRLVSRNGYEFARWSLLKQEIADTIRADSAILDGEIVCFDADGRSNFNNLLFRRAEPFFCAFDALMIDGDNLRGLRLLDRKRRLLDVMPKIEGRLRYVDYIHERGIDFFRLACEHDLEGIVAKWIDGTYQQGTGTRWLKIKNPSYSQMDGPVRPGRFVHWNDVHLVASV
jgi:bifunctional non-homologous end joining protein LigD